MGIGVTGRRVHVPLTSTLGHSHTETSKPGTISKVGHTNVTILAPSFMGKNARSAWKKEFRRYEHFESEQNVVSLNI